MMGRNNISAGEKLFFMLIYILFFFMFLKYFWKNLNFFYFFIYFKLIIFWCFSDILILKIIFNIIFILLAFLLPRDALLFDVIILYIYIK